MRRLGALLTALAFTASLTACGPFQSDMIEDYEPETIAEPASEEETEAEQTTGRYDSRQVCYKTLGNSEKPEVYKIRFSGLCDDNIKKHATVRDLYGVDYISSGTVGLVGSPIEVTFEDCVREPEIAFMYAEKELRGVPEDNLIMLHINADNGSFDTVKKAELDTENDLVSAHIKEQGTYLLVDAYQWYEAWGEDTSKYAYDADPTAYKTDWERECDTGDIMKLADKQWAKENAPDFRVSTAEELASVVYYVNGVNKDGAPVTITLEDNIDLTGYNWKPIGWYNASDHYFSGEVDGKGHTINGMRIKCGYEDCGFIGYGLNVVMHDISFTNADVLGTACTGIAGGEIYFTTTWTNVRAQGCVKGGSDDYGAIIGREAAITFKNCAADVTVEGEPFEYLSYRQKRIDEVEVVETFHLTRNADGTITRDDHSGFQNLCWHIELDGAQVLERSATAPRTGEPELTLDTQYQWIQGSEGKHTIYLVAYINGAYIRVSNIIEYEGTGN
ncbi:MAG: hypothetical protein K6A75_02465 [Ruminococcus sp.]|nr:hypothetical protein [Ruminococcus sp.]